MTSSHEAMESLRRLRGLFDSKRNVIARAVQEFEVQRNRWDEEFSENSVISKALSYAKTHKQFRTQKLAEFDASFAEIFVKIVDPLLSSGSCEDWSLLARLEVRVKNDRALNVADPIWCNFLRCFNDLTILNAEPVHLRECRQLIQSIERWEPDEKFIVGDSRNGLNLILASKSDDAGELKGMSFSKFFEFTFLYSQSLFRTFSPRHCPSKRDLLSLLTFWLL
jgi:hypothetical protein